MPMINERLLASLTLAAAAAAAAAGLVTLVLVCHNRHCCAYQDSALPLPLPLPLPEALALQRAQLNRFLGYLEESGLLELRCCRAFLGVQL